MNLNFSITFKLKLIKMKTWFGLVEEKKKKKKKNPCVVFAKLCWIERKEEMGSVSRRLIDI